MLKIKKIRDSRAISYKLFIIKYHYIGPPDGSSSHVIIWTAEPLFEGGSSLATHSPPGDAISTLPADGDIE